MESKKSLRGRQALENKVIDMAQICGIREYSLENGLSEGVRVAEPQKKRE